MTVTICRGATRRKIIKEERRMKEEQRNNSFWVKIFRKLARQGDRDAMNNYAFAYLNGLGVKKNTHLAKFWLMKAIEKGNMDSAVSYAQLVFGGVFPRENWNLSVWLCFWAADNGNAGAMNELGLFYEEAAGMLKNYDKAFEWFKKSAGPSSGSRSRPNTEAERVPSSMCRGATDMVLA